MQLSLRALGTLSLMSVLAWAHQSCNTVGVAEVFMSPDSDENGRQWQIFPPASESINCIARLATGRKDITLLEKIVQTKKFDGSAIAPTTVGSVTFRPEPGTKLSVQTLTITPNQDPKTDKPLPFDKGEFRCEIYSDNGSSGELRSDGTSARDFGTSPLASTTFTIDYLPCPLSGSKSGDACADIYDKGTSKTCRAAGTTDPNKMCTCDRDKKTWVCPAGEDGVSSVNVGKPITGNPDAGTTATTTTTPPVDAGG